MRNNTKNNQTKNSIHRETAPINETTSKIKHSKVTKLLKLIRLSLATIDGSEEVTQRKLTFHSILMEIQTGGIWLKSPFIMLNVYMGAVLAMMWDAIENYEEKNIYGEGK